MAAEQIARSSRIEKWVRVSIFFLFNHSRNRSRWTREVRCRLDSFAGWIIVQHGSGWSFNSEREKMTIGGWTGKANCTPSNWCTGVREVENLWLFGSQDREQRTFAFYMRTQGEFSPVKNVEKEFRIRKWMENAGREAHKPLKIYAIAFGNWILIELSPSRQRRAGNQGGVFRLFAARLTFSSAAISAWRFNCARES